MNAVTVGLGTLAGSALGATPWLGTLWDGLWMGGASLFGSPGLSIGLASTPPALSAGLVAGTALSPIIAALKFPDVFFLNGILGTLFSGAFSQLFNVAGNVFAGLV